MKLISKIWSAFTVVALGSGAQAASIIGVINFSSGDGGGVVLQDSAGNVTTDLAAATGVKEWLVPEVDSKSGSFLSVPEGQSVSFSQPWVFNPSTPMTPLWSFGDFTFNLSSIDFRLQNSSTLSIKASGTFTSTTPGLDPTPADWFFTTQSPATDGKFSWSASAVPETGTSALLGAALLGVCFLRRRKLT